MQQIRKEWSFGSTREDMVHLWKVYCLSVLEQSCMVWDSGLSIEKETDLERTQKTFVKLVLQEEYKKLFSGLKSFRFRNT